MQDMRKKISVGIQRPLCLGLYRNDRASYGDQKISEGLAPELNTYSPSDSAVWNT